MIEGLDQGKHEHMCTIKNIETLLAQKCDIKQLQQIIDANTQQHFAFYAELLYKLEKENDKTNEKVLLNLIDKICLLTRDEDILNKALKIKWRLFASKNKWFKCL